jgi:WD40 repeat protein
MDRPDSLSDVLAAYFRAKERGEPVDRARLIEENPALASEIQEFLAAEDALVGWRKDVAGEAAALGPALPHALGSYELLEEIGRGGMGAVYKARHLQLGHTVAVKVLLSGALASAEERQRFQREMRAAAKVNHPNIVPLLEAGEAQGLSYYAMQLVDGVSLAEDASRFAGEPRAAALLVETAARAIDHAHRQGVVHRDLKPGNLLIDAAGEPHIADFGLSRLSTDGDSLTRTGTVVGTLSYMAPEQALGGKEGITSSVDVYALGAILYELLGGRPPFRGRSDVETLEQILRQDLLPPSKLRAGVPRDLEVIALKCLEKEPGRRYGSALDLAEDLRRFREGLPIQARPLSTARRAVRWARRRPGAAAAIALGAAILVAGAAGSLWYNRVLAERARELEWTLYASRMHEALQAAEGSRFRQLEELLAHYGDGGGREELRGFEWGYLKGLTSHARAAVPCGETPLFLAFVDGGARLAVGELHRLELRDARTLELVETIRARSDASRCAVAPLSGRWVAFGAESVELVELSGAKTQRNWVPRHDPARGLLEMSRIAASPDGRWLAAYVGKDLGILDTTDLQDRRILDPHSRGHTVFVFSPDSRLLATAGVDGTVKLWEVATLQERGAWAAHRAYIRGLSFSHDGRFLATASDDETARLWEVENHSEKGAFTCRGANLLCVAFSPDDKRLAVGIDDASVSVRLLEVPALREVWSFRGHTRSVVSLAFSTTGTELASGSEDNTVRLWDLERPGASQARGAHADIVWVAGLADGGRTLVTGSQDFVVKAWDLESGRARGELREIAAVPFPHESGDKGTISPDGSRVATASRSGRLVVSRLRLDGPEAGKSEEAVLDPPGQQVWSLAFSADSRRLLAAGRERDGEQRAEIRIWRREGESAWSQTHAFAVPALPSDPQFSPDGRLLLLDGAKGKLLLWDMEAGGEWASLGGEGSTAGALTVCAVSPDGVILAAGGLGGQVAFWRSAAVEDGKVEPDVVLNGHNGRVTGLQFFPDGRRLASVSDDGALKTWGFLDKGGGLAATECIELEGTTSQVKCLVITPDGRTLVAAGGKIGAFGEVRVYYAAGWE